MNPPFALPDNALERLSQKYHVRKLALFGSILTAHFRDDSDVDMLVEFNADAQPDLFDMAALEIELSTLVGRKVDLRTPEDLSRYFRQAVVEGSRTVYERR